MTVKADAMPPPLDEEMAAGLVSISYYTEGLSLCVLFIRYDECDA